MAEKELLTFYADVKPDLCIIAAVIGIPKTAFNSLLSVSVTENEIEVKSGIQGQPCKKLWRFKMEGISILPATCSRLQLTDGQSLHLRFQLNNQDAVPSCDDCPASAESDAESRVASVVDILSRNSYAICCQACASLVGCNKKFCRVLPCPSDDWFEVSESWWCGCQGHDHHDSYHLNRHQDLTETTVHIQMPRDHRSSDDLEADRVDFDLNENLDHQSNNAESCLCYSGSWKFDQDPVHDENGTQRQDHHSEEIAPCVGDSVCLVSDSYLTFDEKHLLPGRYLVTDKDGVKCSRCRCLLGRLLKSDLVGRGNRLSGRSDKCVQLMMRTIVVSAKSPAINLIPSSHTLEAEVAFLLQREHQTSNSFRFIFEMRDDQNIVIPVVALWVLDVKSLLYQASLISDEETCTVQPQPIIKLLYKDCLRDQNKSLGQAWYRDLTVESVELPEAVCLSILHILIKSTKALPSSLHLVSDFYAGYLRRETGS